MGAVQDSAEGDHTMIKLTINGKGVELREPVNVLQFLQSKKIKSQFVAVAHNGDVLRKDEYTNVLLEDGDVLEVVRPVGGG